MAATITDSPHHLPIPPAPDGEFRPVWSVMIPTYNCADYLRQTLESVLIQDPGPAAMQIEVVDDCSTTDDPETVVSEMGRGRVGFFRQPPNVGAMVNFNTCVQRSQGKIVHLLHGDDLVRAGFYEILGRPLLDDPELGAAFCRQVYVDEHGHHQLMTRLEQPRSGIFAEALEVLAVSNRIPPPSIAIKRKVYESLGGYDSRLIHSADWEMWVRIAARYPIWYEIEPLAIYRVHSSSDTSKLVRTGANIQDRRRCIQLNQQHLPSTKANSLTRKALAYSTMYGLRLAYQLFKSGQHRLSLAQLREAGLCVRQMLLPGITPQ